MSPDFRKAVNPACLKSQFIAGSYTIIRVFHSGMIAVDCAEIVHEKGRPLAGTAFLEN
jgi:hypothetical protein